MDRPVDIHKAGGIIIRGRRLLLCRSRGKDVFIAPGGKVETGETVKQALVRELAEELAIRVDEANLAEFGTFYAEAAGQAGKWLQMDVLLVKSWSGEIRAASEIEEIRWVTSKLEPGLEVGSIFEHEVIPLLKERDLID